MRRMSDIEAIEVRRSVVDLVRIGRTTEYLSDTLGISARQIREWLEQSAGQDGMSSDRMSRLGPGELPALRQEISAMRRRRDVLRVMHAIKVGDQADGFSRRPVTISIRAALPALTGSGMQG